MSSPDFQSIIDDALDKYHKQTGTDLRDTKSPFADKLKDCNSPGDILALLQEKEKDFNNFRDKYRKVIDSLKPIVQLLHAISGTLGDAVSLVPFTPAKAIFIGIDMLLTASFGVSTSYDALVDLFVSIECFLRRLDIYTKVKPTLAMKEIAVKIMVEVLSTIALATKQIKQGRLKKFAKKLLGENDVEAVLKRLDRLTQEEARATVAQTLEIVHGLVDNMKVIMDDGKVSADDVRKTLVVLQQVASEMNKSKHQQFRSWLSPPDPWKNHHIACGARHEGTARWFIESETFSKWKSSGSLLWIHGKPGSGKSVLSSSIIQDVERISETGFASMAFFYCDFRDDEKQNRRGLLTSLLLQLCEQSDTYCSILSKLYSVHRDGSRSPSDRALTECLKEMLQQRGQAPIYIIVDGLDECPNTSGIPSSRENVLRLVKELVDQNITNFHLCVTSRLEQDIQTILDPLAFRSVSHHDQAGQRQDIIDYIRSVVSSDPKTQRWRDEDKNLVIDELSRRAGGMFRWVFCQLDFLRGCQPAGIRRALNELPNTLDAIYERTLQGIDEVNWEYTHRLFQCVAVASRPLRVEELANFLAFDLTTGSLPDFLPDCRVEDPRDAVLSTCSSLLAVVDVDGSLVIQFSHFSVKEFLMSDRLDKATDTVSRYRVHMQRSHTIVAQACLAVLLKLDPNLDESSIKRFPVTLYAAQHWVDHAKYEDVSLQVGMELLLDPSQPHFAIWTWITDILLKIPLSTVFQKTSLLVRAPVYHTALCGCQAVEELLAIQPSLEVDPWLLQMHGIGIGASALVSVNSTPLRWALQNGHLKVARVLLGHCADVNARDNKRQTPLHWASRYGHLEVALILLEHGTDANSRDDRDSTPLHLASQEGLLEVALILLKHVADQNSRDDRNSTPLHLASQEGHLEVARVLLEHHADPNLRDDRNSTPLRLALQGGHLEVARVLLERRADPNSRDDRNSTPLHLASQEGHLEVARVLLEHLADPNSRDDRNFTPLHLASQEGRLEVARVLLKHGADPNSRDDRHFTPLHLALQKGRLEVARVLLEHGANPNSRDDRNFIPLHLALQEGRLEVALILLEHGADPNPRDDRNFTPLHLASQEGRPEVARVLLEHLADPNSRDDRNSTSLHLSSQEGHLLVALILLEYGADPNSRDDRNSTPLHLALQEGHLEVARALLKHGADANVEDDRNWTPLHWAYKQEFIRLLFEYGAEPRFTSSYLGFSELFEFI